MTHPVPGDRPEPVRLYRYEVHIRTRVGPALVSWIGHRGADAVVPRPRARRLAVFREEDDAVDLPAVVQRLTECDVAVLEARRCQPSTARKRDAL